MTEAVQKTGKRVPVVHSLKLIGDGTKGIFTGRKCRKCGEYFVGAPVFCLNCSASDLEPGELSTQGILSTYTIIWTPPAGWQGAVPYILGSVHLPEGVEILTEVIDCPRENIKIGMKMELVLKSGGLDANGNEIMVHKWKPVV
jgi:uncharacterized OB-fold protein